jgi:hypothetical protein
MTTTMTDSAFYECCDDFNDDCLYFCDWPERVYVQRHSISEDEFTRYACNKLIVPTDELGDDTVPNLVQLLRARKGRILVVRSSQHVTELDEFENVSFEDLPFNKVNLQHTQYDVVCFFMSMFYMGITKDLLQKRGIVLGTCFGYSTVATDKTVATRPVADPTRVLVSRDLASVAVVTDTVDMGDMKDIGVMTKDVVFSPAENDLVGNLENNGHSFTAATVVRDRIATLAYNGPVAVDTYAYVPQGWRMVTLTSKARSAGRGTGIAYGDVSGLREGFKTWLTDYSSVCEEPFVTKGPDRNCDDTISVILRVLGRADLTDDAPYQYCHAFLVHEAERARYLTKVLNRKAAVMTHKNCGMIDGYPLMSYAWIRIAGDKAHIYDKACMGVRKMAVQQILSDVKRGAYAVGSYVDAYGSIRTDNVYYHVPRTAPIVYRRYSSLREIERNLDAYIVTSVTMRHRLTYEGLLPVYRIAELQGKTFATVAFVHTFETLTEMEYRAVTGSHTRCAYIYVTEV